MSPGKKVNLEHVPKQVVLEIPGFLRDETDPSAVIHSIGGQDQIAQLLEDDAPRNRPRQRVQPNGASAGPTLDLKFRNADPNSGVTLSQQQQRAGLVVRVRGLGESRAGKRDPEVAQVVGKVFPKQGSGIYGPGGTLADVVYFKEASLNSSGEEFGELGMDELLERMTMSGRDEQVVAIEDFWSGRSSFRTDVTTPKTYRYRTTNESVKDKTDGP